MKKIIFPLLVLPLVMALASCGLNPAPGGSDESPGEDPGSTRELPRYITMRLADQGEYESDSIGINMGEPRTLTYDNARSSHDFFEAVFMYGNPGNYTIARVTWVAGETPALRGVHRTPGGIDYGFVTSEGRSGTEGAAVLFVGTKSDKTLLALGRLVEVDGIPNKTTIDTNSRSVTFEVAALKAGVRFNNNGLSQKIDSSFFTNYLRGINSGNEFNSGGLVTVNAENTVIEDTIYIHYAGKKFYPLFKLNNRFNPSGNGANNVTWGYYNFDVDTVQPPTLPAPGSPHPSFTEYAAGIVLAGGYNCETRNPRYLITGEFYQYSSFLVQDLRTTVTLVSPNNARIGSLFGNPPSPYDPVGSPAYFGNPVKFTFNTSTSREAEEDGYVFALVFEIFVHNLTARPTTRTDSPDPGPVKWRISPGYNQKWLDLDDGFGGDGGAIFLGTGDVSQYLPDP